MLISVASAMNNYRAGLYGFVSTTTWLHKAGMASPPLLVVLGLTLPDSRILSGIAGIGLTLADIAIILPHLRQPIFDSLHPTGGVLTSSKSIQEQKIIASHKLDPSQSGSLPTEIPAFGSPEPCKKDEHQGAPLVSGASFKSVLCADVKPLAYSDTDSEVAAQTNLPSPAGSGINPIAPRCSPSLREEYGGRNIGFSVLFTRDNRTPVYVSLPVPDEDEVAFFNEENALLSDSDPGEEFPVYGYEQHTIPEEDWEEDQGLVPKQDDQLAVIDLPASPGAQERVHSDRNLSSVVVVCRSHDATCGQAVTDGKISHSISNLLIQDNLNPLVQATIPVRLPDPPACGDPVKSTDANTSCIARKDMLNPTRQRPESLEFIPQSVIRRYPSTLGRQRVRHEPFESRHEQPASPAPSHIVAQDPKMLLEGTRPRASYVTLPEDHWRALFLTEVTSTERSKGGIESVTVQPGGPVEQQPVSLREPQEHILHQENSTSRRRLGVLGRAALRNRRSAVQRRKIIGDDESLTSDSDSDSDNDSQCSSGSSAYESMLPHMLGTDLIAAIEANSESGLNFAGPRKTRTKPTPLNVYEDFLISEDSATNLSLILYNNSSNDDTSEGGSGARTTDRSLTYEDIQLWASGVVQKCVKQVCLNRTPAAPSSPSQVSDICAERPSGSGVSQCPLAGLHCKLGTAAATKDVSAQRAKELDACLRYPAATTSALPSRTPMQVRHLGDIPEFVPRQRQMEMIKGRVEGPRRRSAIDITRDAATRVIARMESRAGFNTRQWLAGTECRRMVGGRHGTLGRCA